MCDFRRWVQAVFCSSSGVNSSSKEASVKVDISNQETVDLGAASIALEESVNNSEVDISEGLAFEMFGISPSEDNEVNVCPFPFILFLF